MILDKIFFLGCLPTWQTSNDHQAGWCHLVMLKERGKFLICTFLTARICFMQQSFQCHLFFWLELLVLNLRNHFKFVFRSLCSFLRNIFYQTICESRPKMMGHEVALSLGWPRVWNSNVAKKHSLKLTVHPWKKSIPSKGKSYTLENEHVPQKRDCFNRKYIFQTLIFTGHVSFRGSNVFIFQPLIFRGRLLLVSGGHLQHRNDSGWHLLDVLLPLPQVWVHEPRKNRGSLTFHWILVV